MSRRSHSRARSKEKKRRARARRLAALRPKVEQRRTRKNRRPFIEAPLPQEWPW